MGQPEKATDYFEKVSKLYEELYEANRADVSFKNGLAISYQKLGDTYSSLGQPEKALSFFEDGTRLFEKLFEANRANVIIKNGLAISYANLGVFSRDQRSNMAEVRRWFEKAEVLWAELATSFPAYAEFQQNWSKVQKNLEGL